ncbi:amyloid beta precursor protein binding family B member 2-like [Argopecten irradians]|uniref:amyloid beta precursor protein binding family B member 2-like n=1 Tax=Argopecten irradians TaxID=31199 RepID=UPI003715C25C
MVKMIKENKPHRHFSTMNGRGDIHSKCASMKSSESCTANFLKRYGNQKFRTRKFNLNMYWYGSLYRRLNRWERTWSLHHNPIYDSENTYLSFANPNYQFEDRMNSNMKKTSSEDRDPSIYDDVDDISTLSLLDQKSNKNGTTTNKNYTPEKKRLLSDSSSENLSSSEGEEDLSSDEDNENEYITMYETKKLTEDLNRANEKDSAQKEANDQTGKKNRGFLGYYSMLESKAREKHVNNILSPDTEDEPESAMTTPSVENLRKLKFDLNSPDSNDSGIQSDARSDDGSHHHGSVNDNLYSLSNKTPLSSSSSMSASTSSSIEEKEDSKDDEQTPTGENDKDTTVLPAGWEKCEDEDGPYYWHVKSGTIQREPPSPAPPETKPTTLRSISVNSDSSTLSGTSTSSILSLQCKYDVVERWGDGKDLYLDLDRHSLRLVDTQDFSTLNSQPIQSIRVWGVGRDNGRDFAYVAREKQTKKHMCHVFRCDTPARQIANCLRDICKKIMMERRLQENAVVQRLSRPTDLPNLGKSTEPNGQKLSFQSLYNNASFPTPMEEPKKIIRCHYIGLECVTRPTGTEIINSAIDAALMRVPPEKWLFVNVNIAPSTITISEHGKPENKIDECRVRYLSFMGISVTNPKVCAFINHGAEDQFYAQVFHCEPTAGPLCKTIEAACKLRYQKCLDAHPTTPTPKQPTGKTISEALKSSAQTVQASVKVGAQSMQAGVKTGALTVQAGVKTGALTVQAGVKAGLSSVHSVFSRLKNKTLSPKEETQSGS